MNGTAAARIDWADVLREVAIMIAVAIVLAAIGPFGSFAQPGWLRFVEWLIFAIGGYAFFRPVIAGGDALSASARLPRWIAIGLACALAAIPTTVLVAITLAGWRFARIDLGSLMALYPDVLLLGAIVTAVQILLAERRAVAAPVEPIAPPLIEEPAPSLPPPSIAPGTIFLDRLPPAIGRDLLCVENEDHYVRAHTALGSGLILMRLRDAVAELEGMDGARVHRGWWVARAAVAGVVRRDRAIALRLANGLEVPVARNEAPALRAAGWL